MAVTKLTRRQPADDSSRAEQNSAHLIWGDRATPIAFTDETDDLRWHVPFIARSARHILHLTRDEMLRKDNEDPSESVPALEGVELLLSMIEALEEVAAKREHLAGATT